VKPSADSHEIKKAYRSLALQWHPDKNPENLEEATVRFKQIGEAYEILEKPENREAHDLKMKTMHSGHGSRSSYRDFSFEDDMFEFHFTPPDDLFREMFDDDFFDDSFLFGFPPGLDVVMEDHFPIWDDDLLSPDRNNNNYSRHTHSYVVEDKHLHHQAHDSRQGSRRRRRTSSRKKSTRSESVPEGVSVVTTSISTKVVDGVQITTKKRVENGVETIRVYENDVLKSETIRGLHNQD
jgi:DnaJ family protein B protein 6